MVRGIIVVVAEYPRLPSMSRFCKEDECIDEEDCTLERTRFCRNLLFTCQCLDSFPDLNPVHEMNFAICEGF